MMSKKVLDKVIVVELMFKFLEFRCLGFFIGKIVVKIGKLKFYVYKYFFWVFDDLNEKMREEIKYYK